MTRAQTNVIRGATGEELLMLHVFFGDRFGAAVERELDRRAATRPPGPPASATRAVRRRLRAA